MDVLRASTTEPATASDGWMSSLADALGDLPQVERPGGSTVDEFKRTGGESASASLIAPPEPAPHADVPPPNNGRGFVLELDHLHAYCDMAARMVQSAQLGREHVSGDWVVSQLKGLKHVGSLKTKLELPISDETGLPMRSAWHAVQGARRHAEKNQWFRDTTGAQVWQQLADVQERTLDTYKIEVLDVDAESGARRFRLSFDCHVDPGYLSRTTIVIEQPKQSGGKRNNDLPMATLNGRDWTINPKLANLLQSAAPAPLSYFAVTALAGWGTMCREFSRGVIGPIYMEGVAQPGEIAEILDQYPGNAIGCFRSFRITRLAESDDTSAISHWQDPADSMLSSIEASGFHPTVREVWVAPRELVPELELRARLGERPVTIREMY